MNPPDDDDFDDDESILGMVRRDDYDTSIEAAHGVKHIRAWMKGVILAALQRRPMTDEEVENMFKRFGYSYSTARKRRSELYHDDELVFPVGKKKNSKGFTMTLWAALP